MSPATLSETVDWLDSDAPQARDSGVRANAFVRGLLDAARGERVYIIANLTPDIVAARLLSSDVWFLPYGADPVSVLTSAGLDEPAGLFCIFGRDGKGPFHITCAELLLDGDDRFFVMKETSEALAPALVALSLINDHSFKRRRSRKGFHLWKMSAVKPRANPLTPYLTRDRAYWERERAARVGADRG